MLIKSQAKYIQSLSQKKLRDQEGVFVAEGVKLVGELLQAGNVQLQQLFAVKEWIDNHSHLSLSNVVEITAQELSRLSALATPNEVIAVFKKPLFDSELQPENNITLMLDGIQDPGNMGTIIRCADWFGIKGMVCSSECADAFNPKVVQATMGSISRVQVIYEDLNQFIQKHRAVKLYATTLDGNDVTSQAPIKEGIILIGNESKGIQKSLIDLAAHRITIPRKGNAESLNAAVATGIILSHLLK